MVYGEFLQLKTKGFSDIIDVTHQVQGVVSKSGITGGIVHIFVTGSTGSVSTIEYEPALVKDVQEKLSELISEQEPSRHSQTWGDDNGFSHMRATLMGPGISVPIHRGGMVLGTWQQIVVIDHDNRPRKRDVFIQVMGE